MVFYVLYFYLQYQKKKTKIQSIPDNSNNFVHLVNKKQLPYFVMCLSSDTQNNKTLEHLI